MSNLVLSQASSLARSLSIEDSNVGELVSVLKATAFKGQVSDAQMAALLIVSQQYGLNPWTKEIYAFPDKNNGIVPVVGVDGWSRIINNNPMFDGMDFEQDNDSCTCIIYRKDRSHPVRVTEWMSECKRNLGPWLTHPKRMLRHKAMIQCARLAFGFVGIYEQDEAERIVEAELIETKPARDISVPQKKIESAPIDGESKVIGEKKPHVEGKPLTEGMKKMIASKLETSGKAQDDLGTAFPVIDSSNVNDVLAWIAK